MPNVYHRAQEEAFISSTFLYREALEAIVLALENTEQSLDALHVSIMRLAAYTLNVVDRAETGNPTIT